MGGYAWSEEEVAELRRLTAEGRPTAYIAEHLKRTSSAVRLMKTRLGLRNPAPTNCPICGKDLVQVPGQRARATCSSKCKYWALKRAKETA